MAGYFGTPSQQALQAAAEASVAFVRATPGACQVGRMVGCDDPDRFGWDRIDSILERDGVCGFRLIAPGKADELRHYLGRRGFRLDTWEVFVADRDSALACCERIVAGGLPQGLRELPAPTEAEGDDTARTQARMAEAGVVPFSGSFLAGRLGPAVTVILGDTDGQVAAAAHGYLPHNDASSFRRYAWGGLVCVAASERGRGLGSFVNARMIEGVFRTLDATHVYELVALSNLPSRRMVEACGLRHEPALVCGVATREASARVTR